MLKQIRQKHVDEKYRGDQAPPPGDAARIQAILSLVGSNKRVLDVGCYAGFIGSQLRTQNNDVYGLDFSKDAVRLAREKGIQAYQLDVETDPFPFPAHYFDAILAAEIIEHIYDTDAFLDKLKNLLAPGGSLILTTPNLATLGRRLLLLCGKNPIIESGCRGGAAGHIRYFVKKSLFDLLRDHDFVVDAFVSDVLNFSMHGAFYLRWPAQFFPTIGKTLIVRAHYAKKDTR